MKDNIPVGKSRYSSKTNQFHTSWYHSSASFHTGSTQPSRAVTAGGIQEGQFLCIISGYVLFTDLSCIGLMWRWVILFPIVITNGLNSSIEGDLELKTVKEAFSCKDCGETGEHAKTWLMCWGSSLFPMSSLAPAVSSSNAFSSSSLPSSLSSKSCSSFHAWSREGLMTWSVSPSSIAAATLSAICFGHVAFPDLDLEVVKDWPVLDADIDRVTKEQSLLVDLPTSDDELTANCTVVPGRANLAQSSRPEVVFSGLIACICRYGPNPHC